MRLYLSTVEGFHYFDLALLGIIPGVILFSNQVVPGPLLVYLAYDTSSVLGREVETL